MESNVFSATPTLAAVLTTAYAVPARAAVFAEISC